MRWFILSMLILCVSASSSGGKDAEVSVNSSLADVEPLMVPGERNLRVCAFNVKIFGRTYMRRKRESVDRLIQILSRCDILFFQEIRDISNTAFPSLMEKLNAATSRNRFSYEISDRLGRSRNKEQYAYIYRTDLLTVERYQILDQNDTFEREPFAAKVTSKESVLCRSFGLLGIHVKPSDAMKEIAALKDAYLEFKEKFGIEDVVILGDLNADCDYVNTQFDALPIRNDSTYQWLIDDAADTTVMTTTNCAYDRFVAVGRNMQASIKPNSATVYRFDQKLSLSQREAYRVSDHYPIEFQLYGKCNAATGASSSPELSSNDALIDWNEIRGNLESGSTSWNVEETFGNSGMLEANGTSDDLYDLMEQVTGVLTGGLFPTNITIRVSVSPEETTIEIKKQIG